MDEKVVFRYLLGRFWKVFEVILDGFGVDLILSVEK